jgi:hypothetical protein
MIALMITFVMVTDDHWAQRLSDFFVNKVADIKSSVTSLASEHVSLID